MANEIVWFDSDEVGAPTLNNAAGSLIAVLDALLVTGFNTQALTSISVTSGVATATKAGHGYGDARMVDISGAGAALVNGRKKITVTGSGTFTFLVPGVADGAVSGSIAAKRSPLGWARTHAAGATVGMYSRTDVTATTMSLRLDDTAAGVAGTNYARAVMVEAFTDVNIYTNPSPTVAQLSGGQYWGKGANTATAKQWVLVGDGKTIYFFGEHSSYPASTYGVPYGPHMFGDIASDRAGDAYGCALAGPYDSSGNGTMGVTTPLGTGQTQGSMVLARLSTGIGAAVGAAPLGYSRRFGGSPGPSYPSRVDNGMVISAPVLVLENDATFGHPVRGTLRGVGDPLANIGQGLLHKQVLPNLTGSSRTWLTVGFVVSGGASHMAFDITGPWG